MNKIWLVLQREYLTRVVKKSFLITTILVPLVIISFYVAMIAVSISGTSDEKKTAILDEAGLFDAQEAGGNLKNHSAYVFIKGRTEAAVKKTYQQEGFSSFLYIPPSGITEPSGIILYSHSSASINTKRKIEKLVNNAIETRRLALANIDPEKYKAITSDVSIDNRVDSGKGEKRGVAGVAFAVSFFGGILIYTILMVYGTMVMRGVMEEKTNRIAEVIVSSVKPFQLMMGKIIGIGGVGLTQFAIWFILIGTLQLVVRIIFPSLFAGMGEQDLNNAAMAQGGPPAMLMKVTQGLASLNIGLIISCFIFYFIGGYLMYAALFAAVGSVVSEDQQEAQQLVFPIMMPIFLGLVIMTKAANDPDSNLALFGSLFPLTSPIVMLTRVTYGVPWWQLALSMLLLVLSFLLFTWMTAKIYRTGILMYGKKVTWKEMMKWAFRKS